MAVIQISKLQVRRGLQENLPQLASGEMGWSVDEQRLWIGNGTLVEGAPEVGNTEILTSNSDVLNAIESYTFKGQESGYTSRTGATVTTAIARSLQNKFDEQISARDFGAVGNGTTDDTAALQRAIDQVFPILHFTTVGVRRQLHIPAGTYLITSTLTIPPYASIRGDGPLSTIIKQTASTETIKLRDSRGQIDAALGTNSATLPFQIDFSNLTLQNTTDSNIAYIDSANDVAFRRVKFLGSLTSPATVANAKASVTFLSSVGTSERIVFDQCQFTQTSYGLLLTGDVTSVVSNECVFDTLYQGISTSANVVSPQNIKVLSSVFDNIAKQAIVSGNDSSVTSAYNYFKSVGYSNGATLVGPSANTAVLSWSTANNRSIGDIFERNSANIAIKPLVEITGTTAPTLLQFSTEGSLQSTNGYTETLAGNVWVAANTGLSISSTTTNLIDYSVTRGSAYRIGTIKVTQSAGSAVFEDDYSETSGTGVELSFQGFGNSSILSYTTGNTAPLSNATLKYTVRSFI
jgi:hypothetical protein